MGYIYAPIPETNKIMAHKLEKKEPRKCGCGKSSNPNGYCDGTHLQKEESTKDESTK